jgi:ATP-dependent RNA helicase DDX41
MLTLYEMKYKKSGPFVMIIVPSRELAIQLQETINVFIKHLIRDEYPIIHSLLCIGGVDIKYQIEDLMRGAHIIIGTPGRLSDLLDKNKFDHNSVKLIVFDEADRLLDSGFDEEIRKVLERMRHTRQKLIFSSTMPRKIQELTMETLYKPVGINISRPSSACINIRQDIEFVREESKLLHIMDTISKTPPPVLIFCENKNDVDELTEYLLLKGIEVCSLHGEKDQEERNQAIKELKEGLKDILIATDIVSKGLDFPNIEHVINYDMPKEVLFIF